MHAIQTEIRHLETRDYENMAVRRRWYPPVAVRASFLQLLLRLRWLASSADEASRRRLYGETYITRSLALLKPWKPRGVIVGADLIHQSTEDPNEIAAASISIFTKLDYLADRENWRRSSRPQSRDNLIRPSRTNPEEADLPTLMMELERLKAEMECVHAIHLIVASTSSTPAVRAALIQSGDSKNAPAPFIYVEAAGMPE